MADDKADVRDFCDEQIKRLRFAAHEFAKMSTSNWGIPTYLQHSEISTLKTLADLFECVDHLTENLDRLACRVAGLES